MTETSPIRPGPLVAVVAFVVLVQVIWWAGGDEIVSNGGFADGDSYTRLLRVQRLVETGDWSDNSMPRANAPFGVTVHWTRPLDVLMLALSLPLAPFVGFAKALFWAGALISPFIHLGLAVAIAWAMVPLLGRTGAYLAGALTATQFGILAFAVLGRADHHMLFALVVVLTLGFLARSFERDVKNQSPARAAGAFLALGLWLGPEFLVFMGLCLGITGIAWLAGRDGSLRQNLSLAQGMFVTTVAAIFVEHGPTGLLTVEYDRISALHLTLASILLIFWLAVSFATVRRSAPFGLAARIGLAVAADCLALAIMLFLFPGLTNLPFADVDPAFLPIQARIADYSGARNAGDFLLYFGSAVFALPWLMWRLRREQSTANRWVWWLMAMASVVYLVFAFQWLRWSLYAALFLTIILADLITCADNAVSEKFPYPARTAIKIPILLGLAVGPLVVGAGLLYAGKNHEQNDVANSQACPILELASHLNAPPWSDFSLNIIASANFGPEILYRTGHRVVATLSHRNAAGVVDGHRIFSGSDEAAIHDLILKREVDLLLLCPGSSHDSYFLMPNGDGSFYRRLEAGNPPDWLHEVTLPEGLAKSLLLFEVPPPS